MADIPSEWTPSEWIPIGEGDKEVMEKAASTLEARWERKYDYKIEKIEREVTEGVKEVQHKLFVRHR